MNHVSVCIQLFLSFYFYCINGSDMPHPHMSPRYALLSPRDNTINTIVQEEYIPLSFLTQLIGYRKAHTLSKISISETAYELFKKLYLCPKQIQNHVLNFIDFRNNTTLQKIYAQQYIKKEIAVQADPHSLPIVAMLDDNNIVVSSVSEPIQIWSCDENKVIFKSNYFSKRPMCFIPPSLVVSASPRGNLNIAKKEINSNTWLDHKVILTQAHYAAHVELLFTHNEYAVAGSVYGDIDVYDLDKTAIIMHKMHGHENSIFCGTQLSPHLFATGSSDEHIHAWDLRKKDTAFSVSDLDAVPFSIKMFDDHSLLIGCSQQPALRMVDLRNTAASIPINIDASTVFDLAVLEDKTLVICSNVVEFFHKKYDSTTIEKLHAVPNTEKVLNISSSHNGYIAMVDTKSAISVLLPITQPLCAREHLTSETLIGIALDTESTE